MSGKGANSQRGLDGSWDVWYRMTEPIPVAGASEVMGQKIAVEATLALNDQALLVP